jgi:hypothetical protein
MNKNINIFEVGLNFERRIAEIQKNCTKYKSNAKSREYRAKRRAERPWFETFGRDGRSARHSLHGAKRMAQSKELKRPIGDMSAMRTEDTFHCSLLML